MKAKYILAVLLTSILFTSCKKEYTCHCDLTSSGGDEHRTVKARKKDAQKACEDLKTAEPSRYSKCSL